MSYSDSTDCDCDVSDPETEYFFDEDLSDDLVMEPSDVEDLTNDTGVDLLDLSSSVYSISIGHYDDHFDSEDDDDIVSVSSDEVSQTESSHSMEQFEDVSDEVESLDDSIMSINGSYHSSSSRYDSSSSRSEYDNSFLTIPFALPSPPCFCHSIQDPIVLDETLNDSVANSSSPKYECPICLENYLGRKPMSTICGHIFCRNCLVRSFTETKRCPMCNIILRDNDVHRVYIA